MTKILIKKEAIELRSQGYSYKYIAQKLRVSKSTLSSWLSCVSYVPNEETMQRIEQAREKSGKAKNRQKVESITKAQEMAKKDIGRLTRRDLFMLGVGLYIGEGSKTMNLVRIINANPKVISFAIRWFKEICGLNNEHFSIRIHLYPDNNVEDCLRFWSRSSGLPRKQFQKTQIDLRTNKKISKRGKLPYGTAHITIKSRGRKEFGVFLARKIHFWMEEVVK
ncbi:MAG: helix-turn-helix domain-containing protein [Parcubacteria group bacterium]|nr:helix-turn-helix domain-containing protein [Parcubacteria group bacterium]